MNIDHPQLTDEERAALADYETSESAKGQCLAFFPRVREILNPHFSVLDLDAAFALLESEEEELRDVRSLIWDGDELSTFGESFFSWAEDSLASPPELSGGEMASLQSFLEGRLGPVEENPDVPSDQVDNPAGSETLEGLPDDVDQTGESLYALPVSPAEEETFALGDLPKMAVAQAEAEREANKKGEEAPIVLDLTVPPVPLPLAHQIMPSEPEPPLESPDAEPIAAKAIEPEKEDLQIEPQPSLEEQPQTAKVSPDRQTKLYSRRPRPKVEEDDDAELLSFSQAPTSPFEKKNQLVIKNRYLGYGKNSEGVLGLCGQLQITYFNQEELVGRLESSNPLLFLLPARLSGNQCTVTYWLPPIAFPHPAGQLTIRTPHDTKIMSLNSLFPKSRTDYMRDRHVLLCLAAPALIGFLYFGFVYSVTVGGIDQEAQSLFPELYEAAMEGLNPDFRGGGLGLYRLKIVPASESLQMIWASVLFLAPLASAKFFHYLSRHRRRKFGGVLAASLLLPTLLMLLTWNFQDRILPLYDHKDFAPLDLKGFLNWGIPANVGIAIYLFLSELGFLDRLIKQRELRIALPVLLTFVYVLVMFIVIYGRSWLG